MNIPDNVKDAVHQVLDTLKADGERMMKDELANFAKPTAAALLKLATEDVAELSQLALQVVKGELTIDDAKEELEAICLLGTAQGLDQIAATRIELLRIRKVMTSTLQSVFGAALKAIIS